MRLPCGSNENTVQLLLRCTMTSSINFSREDGQFDCKLFLYSSWPHSSSSSRPTLFSYSSLPAFFFGTSLKQRLVIFFSIAEFPQPISRLTKSHPVSIYLYQSLFVATTRHTLSTSLALGISKQCGTSNCMRFHSASSSVIMTDALSSHLSRGSTTTFIIPWSTLVRNYPPRKSAVTRTQLFNSTIFDYVYLYTDASSFSPSPFLQAISNYKILVQFLPAYIHYLSTIAPF